MRSLSAPTQEAPASGGSPVDLGKQAVERRARGVAQRLGVHLERVEWTATGEEGDRIYALAVTSRGMKRACMFSQAELERCGGAEASGDAVTSRVSNLVSRHSVRPAGAPASTPSGRRRRRKKRPKAAEAPGPA